MPPPHTDQQCVGAVKKDAEQRCSHPKETHNAYGLSPSRPMTTSVFHRGSIFVRML